MLSPFLWGDCTTNCQVWRDCTLSYQFWWNSFQNWNKILLQDVSFLLKHKNVKYTIVKKVFLDKFRRDDYLFFSSSRSNWPKSIDVNSCTQKYDRAHLTEFMFLVEDFSERPFITSVWKLFSKEVLFLKNFLQKSRWINFL